MLNFIKDLFVFRIQWGPEIGLKMSIGYFWITVIILLIWRPWA